eukprot:scaffold50702_cov66-Phaeocystis_antarctica.AAC.1
MFSKAASRFKCFVMRRRRLDTLKACQHDDQLVGPTAIRREASHRVVVALELKAVTDEDQALRDAAEGRREGN